VPTCQFTSLSPPNPQPSPRCDNRGVAVRRRVRLAVALWVVWAIVIWNVIFDRILVLAGRRYVYAAATAAEGPGPYLRISDWMRPAVTRGFWTAAAAAASLLIVGLLLIVFAARRESAGAETDRTGGSHLGP
jgi:hypothetical protein